ncbi:uncharacterized protein LOC124417557 isoform X2 [Gallus gallus]|uniref:uncharacterized protein LOC124417557 isoform X2 n=1 Tax=Gallus gallus TaxID=9031 RepID=UPI001EFFC636|nr:uncharacterized protein LOC124417557 isoform X2 [Gallus gallus]XP_046792768.1 uncharacterized protein LOC124417557 isoform X2 [Gallus gallus]
MEDSPLLCLLQTEEEHSHFFCESLQHYASLMNFQNDLFLLLVISRTVMVLHHLLVNYEHFLHCLLIVKNSSAPFCSCPANAVLQTLALFPLGKIYCKQASLEEIEHFSTTSVPAKPPTLLPWSAAMKFSLTSDYCKRQHPPFPLPCCKILLLLKDKIQTRISN